jgi:hypothetical protein
MCAATTGGVGDNEGHQITTARVMRALARLQQIHEAISTGHRPSVQDLVAQTSQPTDH